MWQLYLSSLLSAWGDRMWGFAVGLILINITPESLVLSASYGLVSCGTAIMFGSSVGRWIDRTARWKALTTSLILQNSSVVTSAVICVVLLEFKTELSDSLNGFGLILCYILFIIFASAANLASIASSIIVGKDWIVVIAGPNTNKLSKLNSTLRSINLVVLAVAPMFTGFIMNFLSLTAAAAIQAGWNIFSCFVEWTIYKNLFNSHPALARKGAENCVEPFNESYAKRRSKRYATSQGVPEWILGILAGVGAVTGLLGSTSFPKWKIWLGLDKTGLLGFFSQVVCLSLCVFSVWLPGSPFNIPDSVKQERSYYSVGFLMGGIFLSRFGLWIADLTINQILQEEVKELERGKINGVQQSFNQLMDMMKFILVILLPYSDTFGYLIIISFAFICLGMMFYSLYVFRRQSPPSVDDEENPMTVAASSSNI
ncbi:solute carrier family 40 member 1-like isoform X2 [Artemia franciscana]|uniref:solute carrier family 40 member 1-like isoform X2 n=1 Tax=Artemia franciscana TaxID=6661 RepID=UPI0032DBF012